MGARIEIVKTASKGLKGQKGTLQRLFKQGEFPVFRHPSTQVDRTSIWKLKEDHWQVILEPGHALAYILPKDIRVIPSAPKKKRKLFSGLRSWLSRQSWWSRQ